MTNENTPTDSEEEYLDNARMRVIKRDYNSIFFWWNLTISLSSFDTLYLIKSNDVRENLVNLLCYSHNDFVLLIKIWPFFYITIL